MPTTVAIIKRKPQQTIKLWVYQTQDLELLPMPAVKTLVQLSIWRKVSLMFFPSWILLLFFMLVCLGFFFSFFVLIFFLLPSNQDASWVPPRWGVPGISHQDQPSTCWWDVWECLGVPPHPATKTNSVIHYEDKYTHVKESGDAVVSVMCAQCESALLCEENGAPVVNLLVLVFSGWVLSSCTVLGCEHRSNQRLKIAFWQMPLFFCSLHEQPTPKFSFMLLKHAETRKLPFIKTCFVPTDSEYKHADIHLKRLCEGELCVKVWWTHIFLQWGHLASVLNRSSIHCEGIKRNQHFHFKAQRKRIHARRHTRMHRLTEMKWNTTILLLLETTNQQKAYWKWSEKVLMNRLNLSCTLAKLAHRVIIR